MKKPTKNRLSAGFARFIPHRVVFTLALLWQINAGGFSVLAQSPTVLPPAAAPDDRAPMRVRYPAAERLRDLQTDRNYQYGRDTPPPENPIARFFDWLLREFGGFLRSKAYENVWQYVILATVAGIAIYLLAKAEVLGFLFPKQAMADRMDYENLVENIREIDFDAAIDEAAAARNFRLAVRLLYLQTLKQLDTTGRIIYKPDKTNQQYVQELKSTGLQPDFERLTRRFEFVWYGDFPVDERQFGPIRDEFRQFMVRAGSADKPQLTGS